MKGPNSEAAPEARSDRSTSRASRRGVVLSVLIALAFVSGVGASQDDATEGRGEVVVRFDTVAISDLPLHAEDADDLPPVSLAPPRSSPRTEREAGELDIDAAFGPEPAGAPLIVVTKGKLDAGQSLGG